MLSQKRATSAVNYIISQGINAKRLRAKGYGESRLLIANATTEEEHQTNRRTEFKIIEYKQDIKLQSAPDPDADESDRFFDEDDFDDDGESDN